VFLIVGFKTINLEFGMPNAAKEVLAIFGMA
jgi:hypothetical protein